MQVGWKSLSFACECLPNLERSDWALTCAPGLRSRPVSFSGQCQKLDKWEDNCEETSVLLERLISEYPSVLRRGFSHDPAGVILAPYWSIISILVSVNRIRLQINAAK